MNRILLSIAAAGLLLSTPAFSQNTETKSPSTNAPAATTPAPATTAPATTAPATTVPATTETPRGENQVAPGGERRGDRTERRGERREDPRRWHHWCWARHHHHRFWCR